MPQKPVHLERTAAGGKRQRIWTWIRSNQDKIWMIRDLAASLDLNQETVRDYIRGLDKAGYIRLEREESTGVVVFRHYKFNRDNGVHAPRLDRKGNHVSSGRGTEAMWGTMRRADRDWDFRELSGLASTEDNPVALLTARSYVQALAMAGYLVETRPPMLGRNARPARYRLKPAHAKKPLAPMLQRVGAVYDPNEGRVVWTEEVDPDA